MFEVVRTTTADNLVLSGLLSEGDKHKPLVLHIHGFEGDFFTHEFISAISENLHKNNVAFLSVQTRGTANEFLYKSITGDWKQYGAHFELLEEAYLDIDAWVQFAHSMGYSDVVLQGHSLGTIKVVRYLFEGKHKERVRKLILLAPFDRTYLIERFASGKWQEFVMIAKQKVSEGKGGEIIPTEFDEVVMSYKTYVSWHDENDFQHMYDFFDEHYTFPILNKIETPVKVIVGTKDEYFHPSNAEHPEEAIEALKANIKDFQYKLIENAEHSYTGYENIVADEVVNFVR